MTRRGTLWFGWTLAVLAIAGFTRLGFWQYARMQEKQVLLDKVDRALRAERPMGLETDVMPDIARVDGTATGTPLTFLLDNQVRDGRPGVRMYCVVAVCCGAGNRLVDFGWLPMGGDRRMPDARCPTGEIHVRGLMTPIPSSGLRLGNGMQQIDANRWLLTRIDPDEIYAHTKTPFWPRVIRLDPTLPIGYERDLDVLPNTLPPARHLGYAVQWWALAVAVFVTALLLTFRSNRRSRAARP